MKYSYPSLCLSGTHFPTSSPSLVLEEPQRRTLLRNRDLGTLRPGEPRISLSFLHRGEGGEGQKHQNLPTESLGACLEGPEIGFLELGHSSL